MDSRRRQQVTTSRLRVRPAPVAKTSSWILNERPQQPLAPPQTPPNSIASSYTGALPNQLLERLIHDPAFQLVTSDRRTWICPFTGKGISTEGGRMAAARAHLERSGVWRTLQPLPLPRLQTERWRIELTAALPHEPRLRLFSKHGRGWFNPFSGALVPGLELDQGQVTPTTICRIAEVLASCPAAREGNLLSEQEILTRYSALTGTPATTQTSDDSEVVWIGDQVQNTLDRRPGTADLAQARQVQARSLSVLPSIAGLELGVHFAPHSGVSGDFYHATALSDGRILLAVGDVSGHGVQAALVVASLNKTLRFVLREHQDLVEIALACNDELRSDLVSGQFVSLFLATIDPHSLELVALCCGHHQGLLANIERELPLVRIGLSGMALGLAGRETMAKSLRPTAIGMQPGDVLLQITDGLIEATDDRDQEWGEGRWMGSLLARCSHDSAQELADGLVADCLDFTRRPVADDLTVLAARIAKPDPIAESL